MAKFLKPSDIPADKAFATWQTHRDGGFEFQLHKTQRAAKTRYNQTVHGIGTYFKEVGFHTISDNDRERGVMLW